MATIKEEIDKLIGAAETAEPIIEATKKLADISDTTVRTTIKLDLIAESTADNKLHNKVLGSANNTGSLYADTASSFAQLSQTAGESFSGNDEILKFTETFRKMSMLSGNPAKDTNSSMEKVITSIGSGKMSEENFDDLLGKVPLMIQSISDYTGLGIADLRKLASQGKLTADIIKNSMFNAATDIDTQFSQTPMTWEQAWSNASNHVVSLGQPLLDFINLLADNWSILEPIILAVAAALIISITLTKGLAIAKAGLALVQEFLATGYLILNGGIIASNSTMRIFNNTLMACPLTWIILIVIAAIAVFYALIAVINKITGQTLSAAGIVGGIIAVTIAAIHNLLVSILNFVISKVIDGYNFIANFVNMIANLFSDVTIVVIQCFLNMFNSIYDIILNAAGLIDKIFGSNLSGSVEGFKNSIEQIVDDLENGKKVSILKEINKDDYMLDTKDIGDSWNFGYGIGENIDKSISGFFSFDTSELTKGYNPGNDPYGLGDTGNEPALPPDNYDALAASMSDEEFDVNVKDDVNLADESLKYMLDEVSQKYINQVNLQSPAPNVNISFKGSVNNAEDLDAMADIAANKIGIAIVEGIISSTDVTYEV